ncbi:hypothetical protein J2X83_003233 [Brevibacillus nitrificans]|nr:hypothetical protein [Brevibacillus nitrificans]
MKESIRGVYCQLERALVKDREQRHSCYGRGAFLYLYSAGSLVARCRENSVRLGEYWSDWERGDER